MSELLSTIVPSFVQHEEPLNQLRMKGSTLQHAFRVSKTDITTNAYCITVEWRNVLVVEINESNTETIAVSDNWIGER